MIFLDKKLKCEVLQLKKINKLRLVVFKENNIGWVWVWRDTQEVSISIGKENVVSCHL